MSGLFDLILQSFDEDAFWPIMVFFGLPVWLICIWYKLNMMKQAGIKDEVRFMKQKYKSLTPLLPKSKEVKVPIKEMWVFPIRGVRAKAPVDSIELGLYGTRYDREILLASKKEMSVMSTNKHNPTGVLRQELVGSKVIVTTTKPEMLRAKNLPESITIDLSIDP